MSGSLVDGNIKHIIGNAWTAYLLSRVSPSIDCCGLRGRAAASQLTTCQILAYAADIHTNSADLIHDSGRADVASGMIS